MKNQVTFDVPRLADVMPEEFKIRSLQKMDDDIAPGREKIVHAYDIVFVIAKLLAQMRTYEARSPSHQDLHLMNPLYFGTTLIETSSRTPLSMESHSTARESQLKFCLAN